MNTKTRAQLNVEWLRRSAKRRAAGLCVACAAQLTDGACQNQWDGTGVPPRGKHSRPNDLIEILAGEMCFDQTSCGDDPDWVRAATFAVQFLAKAWLIPHVETERSQLLRIKDAARSLSDVLDRRVGEATPAAVFAAIAKLREALAATTPPTPPDKEGM
jgi:hypothetical protein